MLQLGRRSPTIINAAWGQTFMWDGRFATLEEQALGPIQAAAEMNMPLDRLMDRLARIREYKPLFDDAFPGDGARGGPYMQDGSIQSLEAVVEHYDKGGVDRPSRSDLIKPLGLSAQEKADLVSFLSSLTSRVDPTIVPVLPR